MIHLVIGATGLVGKALVQSLASAGEDVHGTHWSRPHPDAEIRLDVLNADSTARLVTKLRPQAIFFAARASPVPAAQWLAAVEALAAVSRDIDARLVFYSSDHVVRGCAAATTETDEPVPDDAAGQLELAAERAVLGASAANLVIRTAEVFGWNRESGNLVMQVWERLQAGEPLTLGDDGPITPTLASYLAEASVRLVQGSHDGLVHVTSGEQTTAVEFARKIARALNLDPALVRNPASPSAHPHTPGTLRVERMTDLLVTPPPGLDAAVRTVRRAWLADTRSVRNQPPASSADELRAEILRMVGKYHDLTKADSRPFVPFESRVNYAGRVYGREEMVNLVESALSFWLTMGPYGQRFEAQMRQFFGSRDAIMVSSGSAANLTAFLALMSPQLERPLRPGDEIITPAVTFPTTLAPIVHAGAIPVFVDCEIGTYNVDPILLAGAISARTRALVIPHTLGNPCDMDVIMQLAREHDLYVIEDSCDALGSTFRGRLAGTFGDLATLSFYPAHHMTTGEGGCVIANVPRLGRIARSVRDWGRDCWCAPGEDNTCAQRFGWQCGDLPAGYDHKFIYSNIGYNFKPTDMQAAVGVAQFDRLPSFIENRKRNFARLYEGLQDCRDNIILPTLDPRSDPSWFGFPITVRPDYSRNSLIQWLERANIETRMIFAGNILRQPAYCDVPHRTVGTLSRTDQIMAQSFFIGVYPGLTDRAIDFIIERFHSFFGR